mgnify:CR=1 FL=1
MSISKKMETFLTKSSWIRKMFEEGARLKTEFGAENVFDFSLGNPNVDPPPQFRQALKETVDSLGPGDHSYMPNSGYPAVRKSVADYLSEEYATKFNSDDIIMTCGAAGALNAVLKAVLNPGEEIITPAPFFVEYGFYADNHGGSLKTVPTHSDFSLDLDAMENAVTENTRAVLINSPNNPTGQVYSEENLNRLGEILRKKSREYKRVVYLISDEPYRKIVYGGITVPSIFSAYSDSILATSYSKEYSIPGERIGLIAVNPEAKFKKELTEALTLANRILGFVNAPALMQRVVAKIQGVSVDVSQYEYKRNLLCDGLKDCGYEFTMPSGAFYLFPGTPVADDVKFVKALQEELILTVPGSGFGGPGHMRISYCVDNATILGSMGGFKKVLEKFK